MNRRADRKAFLIMLAVFLIGCSITDTLFTPSVSEGEVYHTTDADATWGSARNITVEQLPGGMRVTGTERAAVVQIGSGSFTLGPDPEDAEFQAEAVGFTVDGRTGVAIMLITVDLGADSSVPGRAPSSYSPGLNLATFGFVPGAPNSENVSVRINPAVGYTQVAGLRFRQEVTLNVWENGIVELDREGVTVLDANGREWISRNVRIEDRTAILLVRNQGAAPTPRGIVTITPRPPASPTPTPMPTPTPTATPRPVPTARPTATPTSSPVSSGRGEWIVFAAQSSTGGDTDIYAVRTDGSELRRLTDHPANDTSPSLSPDGRRVVFVSNRDGDRNLYMMRLDGTGLTQLTYGYEEDFDPRWSPDGQSIAFVSYRGGSSHSEIWTVRVGEDDIELSTLTLVTYDDFDDDDPTWSPDGRRIAYSSFRQNGGYDIFVINTDGSQMRQVTSGSDWDRSPAWSPDGQSIVFTRWATADLAANRTFSISQTWDERMNVLYLDNMESLNLRGSLYRVGSDGSGLSALAAGAGDAWAPCWSPDGHRLAFASGRDGVANIYIMNADGSGVAPVLRDSNAARGLPSWAGGR